MKTVPDSRDKIIVGVGAGVMVLNFLFLIYTFKQRSYLPLKLKNLTNIFASSVAMLFWMIGTIYCYNNTFLTRNRAICILTLGIFRMSLGGFLFVGLFIYRVYHFILIFSFKQRPTGWYFFLPTCTMATLSAAYAIAAAALPPRYGFDYNAEQGVCEANQPIYYTGIGIIALQMIAAVSLVIHARKMTPLFNEFAEMVVILVAMSTSVGLSVAFRWIIRGDDSRVVIGIINTSLLLVACQIYFIVLLGRPIFHALVDREEYLVFMLHRMKESNLMTEYDVSRQQQKQQQQQHHHHQQRTETAATLQRMTDPSLRSTFTVDSQVGHTDSFLIYESDPQMHMVLVDSWKARQSSIYPDRRIV